MNSAYERFSMKWVTPRQRGNWRAGRAVSSVPRSLRNSVPARQAPTTAARHSPHVTRVSHLAGAATSLVRRLLGLWPHTPLYLGRWATAPNRARASAPRGAGPCPHPRPGRRTPRPPAAAGCRPRRAVPVLVRQCAGKPRRRSCCWRAGRRSRSEGGVLAPASSPFVSLEPRSGTDCVRRSPGPVCARSHVMASDGRFVTGMSATSARELRTSPERDNSTMEGMRRYE